MKTLPFYKEYFSIAYPLPKMDLIAIADFSAGKAWFHHDGMLCIGCLSHMEDFYFSYSHISCAQKHV